MQNYPHIGPFASREQIPRTPSLQQTRQSRQNIFMADVMRTAGAGGSHHNCAECPLSTDVTTGLFWTSSSALQHSTGTHGTRTGGIAFSFSFYLSSTTCHVAAYSGRNHTTFSDSDFGIYNTIQR